MVSLGNITSVDKHFSYINESRISSNIFIVHFLYFARDLKQTPTLRKSNPCVE